MTAITPDIVERALDQIADGQALQHAARTLGVRRNTLYDVLRRDEWAQAYARAREMQAESIVDDMRGVVDRVLTGDLDPNGARVALDHLRWHASKLRPQVYGDKLELTGHTALHVVALDDGELARRVALLLSSTPGAQLEGDAVDVTPTPQTQRLTTTERKP